jgi:hypothetical protein
VTLALALLAPGLSQAAGRAPITSLPVAVSGSNVRLPVKVADASIVYPIIKILPQTRAASLFLDLAITGAATYVGAQAIMDYANQLPSRTGNITFTNNNFYFGEKWAGTFSWGSGAPTTAILNTCQAGSRVASALTECARSQITSYWAGQGVTVSGWACTQNATTFALTCTYNKTQFGSGSAGFNRTSANYPSGYVNPLATEQQLAQAVRDYFTANPNPTWQGVIPMTNNINQAAHEPHPLTQQQLDSLNQSLRDGSQAIDALTQELAQFGRQHGVTGGADPKTVPDATQTDGQTTGENNITVNVNVPTDTPGGTFTAPTLEQVDTFEATTTAFIQRVQAAPIPSTFAAIAASWPTAACPTATVDLGQGLGAHDIMGWACGVWEGVAPIFSVLMAALWGFIGLRIIMTA